MKNFLNKEITFLASSNPDLSNIKFASPRFNKYVLSNSTNNSEKNVNINNFNTT